MKSWDSLNEIFHCISFRGHDFCCIIKIKEIKDSKEGFPMIYPYVTFPDDTEVTFSNVQDDGSVKVYIETPIQGGFKNGTCILPGYSWVSVEGYSDREIQRWDRFLRNNAHLILTLAAEGGFENPDFIADMGGISME